MQWFSLFITPIKLLIRLPRYIVFAKQMRLFAFGAFYKDVKSLFGEGGITVVTRNSDDSKIVIKSVIQADADVIHIVDEQEINSHTWNKHSLKIRRICKRLQFGTKFFVSFTPLVTGFSMLTYYYQSIEIEDTRSILLAAAITLWTLFAIMIWSRFLPYYVSKLPQKIFR